MKTLSRAVGRPDIGGEPMATVFRTFETNQIVLRRAEVSMIAGTPGAGKSTLALALALRMQAPTLYLSADTNAHTMAMRLYSMITGVSQSEAEKSYRKTQTILGIILLLPAIFIGALIALLVSVISTMKLQRLKNYLENHLP